MSNEKKRAALWAPSLRGDLSPTPAQPTPQGVAEVSKSDAGYAAALYAKLYHEAKARVAELERDAARWSHAIIYGFPVRNQTGGGEKKWIAFSTGFDVEFGSNPITAIDAAIAATKEKP